MKWKFRKVANLWVGDKTQRECHNINSSVELHDTDTNDNIYDCVAPHDAYTCNHFHWASCAFSQVVSSCLHPHTCTVTQVAQVWVFHVISMAIHVRAVSSPWFSLSTSCSTFRRFFLFLNYLKSVVNLHNSCNESMDSTDEFSLSTGRRHRGIGRDGRIWNPCEKTQCKGSINAHEWWKIHLPSRGWNGKTFWRRSGSTLIRDSPDSGEEQGNLLGESDGSSSTPFQDSSLWEGEARNDFWSISGNYFTAITWNPESNCTCREKHHSLFHWNTSTWPGLQLHWMSCWRKYRRLLERWWRSRMVRYVDRFHKVQDIGWKTTGSIFMVPRLTKKHTNSRPDTLWPEIWKDVSDASKPKE